MLQTIKSLKLNITEALRALELTVLDEANVDNTAAGKEVGNSIVGDIVGQVAQVSSERRLVGECLGASFADRETYIC